MTGWEPNEHTLAAIEQYFETMQWRLPYIAGIDELIPGCEITNIDTDGVGAGVVPRYISVRINRYVQSVLYRGQPTINVGDIVSVVHFRDADLYEVLMPGGPTGVWASGGGGGAPTNAQYVVMALDAALTQERKLTTTANEIIVNDGGAGGNVTLTAGSLIVQTDQVNTFSVGPQTIQTGGGANVGLIIELDAAQATNAYQVKDSGGNVLSGADERGIIFSDGDTAVSNFFAGADAGNAASAAADNVGVGYRALLTMTAYGQATAVGSGALRYSNYYGNTAVGYIAAMNATSGAYNVAVGASAILTNQTGHYNVAIGANALEGAGAGSSDVSYNVALGRYALNAILTGGNYNTACGYYSGASVTTGTNNVFIGAYAGRRQTNASNRFIVDNQQRADTATELTHAILYGTMGANPEDQQLTINVDALTIGTDADSDVVVTFAANTANGVLTWMEDEDYFLFDDSVIVNDFVGLFNQNELRFYDNGNYVGFEAPALSANQIWVLPDADGGANEFLQTNGAGTLSWAAAGGGALSSTTVSAAGPTDNVDVDGIGIVYIDTSGNDVTIGGFVNGVAGQFIFVVVIDNTEDATLEHAEGTGNQDIYLYNQGDQTLTRDYGGWVLVCDGSNWYQVGGAGSAW